MIKLLLFDIDGTLLEESPTHTAGFDYVCREVYHADTDINSFPRHGMTDLGIFYGMLEKAGLDKHLIQDKINIAVKLLENYVEKNIIPEDYKIIPYVYEFLEHLNSNGIILGILTGNLQYIAELRLEKAGISRFFFTGGYGSDDIVRSKLVSYAVKRCSINIDNRNIYVIGDTPLDIKAARDAGTNSVAVATGIFNLNDLKEADLVLENFKDIKKFKNYIEID